MSLSDELCALWQGELAGLHWSLLLDLGTPAEPTREARVRVREQVPYSGASMIKSWLAWLVSQDVAAGHLHWDQVVEVREEHLTGGDGVLAGWRMPARIALHDLVHLMVAISDNSATNVVADLLGTMAEVNDRIAAAGHSSRMRRWVGGHAEGERANDPRMDQWAADPSLPSPAGLSVVVPAEHHELMWRLREPDHATLNGLFQAQQDRLGLSRYLDEDLLFARKTGSDKGDRHEGGILDLGDGRTLAVTVFTDSPNRVESVEHPGCVARGRAMRETLRLLGHPEMVIVS